MKNTKKHLVWGGEWQGFEFYFTACHNTGITINLVSKYFVISSLIQSLPSRVAGLSLAASSVWVVIATSTLDVIWRGSECDLLP